MKNHNRVQQVLSFFFFTHIETMNQSVCILFFFWIFFLLSFEQEQSRKEKKGSNQENHHQNSEIKDGFCLDNIRSTVLLSDLQTFQTILFENAKNG
jgi:hypothetical protein